MKNKKKFELKTKMNSQEEIRIENKDEFETNVKVKHRRSFFGFFFLHLLDI